MKLGFAFAALSLAAAAPASAAFVTVDLSGFVTGNWDQQGFGSVPAGVSTFGVTAANGTTAVNGTPFDLATDNSNAGYIAFSDLGSGTVTVPVSLGSVTRVHTLINTFWGTTNPGLASITFNATGGVTQTIQLTGGSDIRDYANNSYANTINGTTTTQVFCQDGCYRRLDRQIFTLDAGFAGQTLTSVAFNDSGADGYQRLTITGLTLETADVIPGGVPEPAAWGLMISGFGIAGAVARRRRSIAFA